MALPYDTMADPPLDEGSADLLSRLGRFDRLCIDRLVNVRYRSRSYRTAKGSSKDSGWGEMQPLFLSGDIEFLAADKTLVLLILVM